MTEAEVASTRARRRRRGTRGRSVQGWRGIIVDRRFGRWLFTAMLAVLFLYAASIVYLVRAATYSYDGVQLGMTGSEVRYMFGPPHAVDAAAARWSYLQDGRELSVHFGANGRMDAIACRSRGDARFGCPDMLGVRIGNSEDMLTLTLGPPSREVYGDNTKTMYYDGLGLAFKMRLYMVEEMRLSEGAGFIGYITRALWIMVP